MRERKIGEITIEDIVRLANVHWEDVQREFGFTGESEQIAHQIFLLGYEFGKNDIVEITNGLMEVDNLLHDETRRKQNSD